VPPTRQKEEKTERALQIDLSLVRWHNEFNTDENEAVKDRRTVFKMAHTLYKGPRIDHVIFFNVWKFCKLKVFFQRF